MGKRKWEANGFVGYLTTLQHQRLFNLVDKKRLPKSKLKVNVAVVACFMYRADILWRDLEEATDTFVISGHYTEILSENLTGRNLVMSSPKQPALPEIRRPRRNEGASWQLYGKHVWKEFWTYGQHGRWRILPVGMWRRLCLLQNCLRVEEPSVFVFVGDSGFLRNLSKYVPGCTASRPSRSAIRLTC
jgi:hypothetical protein